MMWYYGGPGWLWMLVMTVLSWSAIVALVVFAVRAFRSSRGDDSAMTLLRRRFAAGEISQEDFEKSRRVLQG